MVGTTTTFGTPEPAGADLLLHFRQAVSQDLTSLAVLQDREPDVDLLADLRRVEFPSHMGLVFTSPDGEVATRLMTEALERMPVPLDQATMDELAVDYADIYLTYRLRASPNESVWTDEEQLERQGSMFAVRQYYFRHGLRTADWRRRADDNLVTQLEFLAYLFGRNPMKDEDLVTAARFMDEHLLRWLSRFARRVATRCATGYFAAVVLLTEVYCEELREHLATLLDIERPALLPLPRDDVPAPDPHVDAPFVPGAGPSW